VTLLSARHISVSFGGLQALDDVSLDVEPGTVVGLIGPNGAGKTTLFNVISGLQTAAGTVSLDGADISPLAAHQRAARGIGRSFQNLGLMMEESVLTNVLAAQHLRAGYTTADLALRPWQWWRGEANLRRRARLMLAELGLAHQAGDAVGDLSFGVARFVELAAVLTLDPVLMLLDEPTTGLDVAEIERLLNVLGAARDQGTTILVVAHDVRFVMSLCDEVHVLVNGQILCRGTPTQVQANPFVVEAYLGRPA
jgi:ABC-type branched-subunit amino acid transport system ATPase component